MNTLNETVALPQSSTRTRLFNISLILGATILLAISAQLAVPVPFSTVPLTMQPFALLLLGAALGWRRAAAAAFAYLLEGAAGLPVFAHGSAGLAAFAGTTGGYLFAFPLTAAIAGLSGGARGSLLRRFGAMFGAIAVLYLGGWSWLVAAFHVAPAAAFTLGVAPFIVADACKAVLAALLAPLSERIVSRFSR